MKSLTIKLTSREIEILNLLASGLSNREIASMMFLSVHTVKAHLECIYRKLNVNNRILACIKALQLGLITIP